MSVAFTTRTTIDRPAGQVWDGLVDWDSAHRWMRGVDWLRADGSTELGTGLTFRSRGKERPASIAGLVPGRSIQLRSQQGGVTADYKYRLDPIDESATNIELIAECTTRGAWNIVGPLLRAAMRRADRGQLDSFRHYVESKSP